MINKIALLFIFILTFSNNLFGQSISEKKGELIFNFASETVWSNRSLSDTFRIVVLGDAPQLQEVLQHLSKRKKIKKKPISIQQLNSIDDIKNPQILIIIPSKNSKLIEINRNIGSSQVLVITDQYQDDKDIMINFTGATVQELSYEVNRIAFLQKKMRYSSGITAFGGHEIDLVKLYKKLEDEILNQEAQLSTNKVELNKYLLKIENSEIEINDLLEQIKDYKKQITEQKQLINSQSNIIIENNRKLLNLNNTLEAKEKELTNELKKLLNNQKRAIVLEHEIANSERHLKVQEKQIIDQSEQIKKQKSIIYSKEKVIRDQKNRLLLSGLIITLIIFIVFMVLKSRLTAKKTARHLQTKNNELTVAQSVLTRSLQKEKKLNRMKSQFVSTASHQFRTPMSIIQTNLGLLDLQKKEMSEEMKGKFDQVHGKIKTQISRMTDLMDEVLIMGEIESVSIKPQLKKSKIELLCKSIVDDHNAIQVDGRKMKLTIINTPRPINIDEKLIEYALSNIVSNAFKFSAGRPDPEMILSFNTDHVEIRIIDYGIGITKEAISTIFEPFFRAENALEINGTGLGTTIAREFIEQNNGKLQYTSELNKKTEAKITIKDV